MLRRCVPIMLILVFALLLVMPAFAQDVTPEVTAVLTATPAPSGGSAPILTPDNAISVSTLIYGLIIAILGGGTVGLVINRFGANKANLDALEKLYLAQSPDSQERERQLFEGLRGVTLRLLDLVDKVTDGQPNAPLAELSVSEGPALAKQTDVDELSRKLDVLKRHYPIPQELAKSILPHEELPEDVTSGSPFPR